MTEISTDLRNELEQAQVYADEYKELFEEQRDENKKLKAENRDLNTKCNNCLHDKSVLSGQLSSLRSENKNLNQKVGEWKAKAELQEKKLIASAEATTAKPAIDETAAKARSNQDVDYDYQPGIFSRFFGTLVGAPVGAVIGTPIGAVRGGVSKAIGHSDDFSDYLGPGIAGEAVGKVGGLGIGAVTGIVTGAVKGFSQGLVLGYKYPFSSESFSLNGDLVSDYDPYDFSISEKKEVKSSKPAEAKSEVTKQ